MSGKITIYKTSSLPKGVSIITRITVFMQLLLCAYLSILNFNIVFIKADLNLSANIQ